MKILANDKVEEVHIMDCAPGAKSAVSDHFLNVLICVQYILIALHLTYIGDYVEKKLRS